LSSSRDILEVYLSDIAKATKQVRDKYGIGAFYDSFQGYQIENLYNRVWSVADKEMLQRIWKREKQIIENDGEEPTGEQIVSILQEIARDTDFFDDLEPEPDLEFVGSYEDLAALEDGDS